MHSTAARKEAVVLSSRWTELARAALRTLTASRNLLKGNPDVHQQARETFVDSIG
jgi:hypothetical protein